MCLCPKCNDEISIQTKSRSILVPLGDKDYVLKKISNTFNRSNSFTINNKKSELLTKKPTSRHFKLLGLESVRYHYFSDKVTMKKKQFSSDDSLQYPTKFVEVFGKFKKSNTIPIVIPEALYSGVKPQTSKQVGLEEIKSIQLRVKKVKSI